MAVDMYLKIDDVKGEADDEKYKDLIELVSWKWGMLQAGSTSKGRGTSASAADVQDIVVMKKIDSSSPNLIKMCCKGTGFKMATLYLRKASGTPIDYVKIELHEGHVTQLTVEGSGKDDEFIENVSLTFKSFKYYYTPQKDGKAGAEIPAAWNIAKNNETVP